MATNKETADFERRYQARLGTPLQAIEYGLQLSLGDDAQTIIFLNDWMVGDVSQWPEYQPARLPAPAEISRWFYFAGSAVLGFLALVVLDIDPVDGLVIALLLVLPAALLLHAAGVKAGV